MPVDQLTFELDLYSYVNLLWKTDPIWLLIGSLTLMDLTWFWARLFTLMYEVHIISVIMLTRF